MSLYGTLSSSNNYGVSKENIALIKQIAAIEDVTSILVVYGSPYILESFPKDDQSCPSTIVMAYQNMPEVIEAVPGALYGTTPFEGKLPVTSGGYREGTSLKPGPNLCLPPMTPCNRQVWTPPASTKSMPLP